MPRRHRITRTAFSVRPIFAATSASEAVPSTASCSCVHPSSPQRSPGRRLRLSAVCRRRSTSGADNLRPRSFFAPASLTCRWSLREPSVPHRATPNAFRHRQTVSPLTPHQYWIASDDSERMALTNSFVTNKPEPPRAPCRRQRGHCIGASDQDVMTTSQSR